MKRYANAGSVVKTLGLNLTERSSGMHKGKLRITKRGSSLARMYLYLAVLRLIQKDQIIKAWYQKKLCRDGTVKKKALIAIMRKLAGALWYVGQGEGFDAAKLFDVNRLSV
jgi:transposase